MSAERSPPDATLERPAPGAEGCADPQRSVHHGPMASIRPRARWGFCPPKSPRSSKALLLSVSLGALACGDGGDGDLSIVPARDAASQQPVTSAVMDVSLPEDVDDEASPNEPARSRVDAWRLSNLEMSSRFVHIYESPRGDVPAQIFLAYDARDRAGNGVHIEWAYDGSALSYDYADLTVAPSSIGFRDDDAQREWRAVAGNVSLVPSDGRVRVELEGLAIVESFGIEEGPREPIEDGFVEGDVERVCIEYVILDDVPINGETGLPEPQRQRDEDWSSPFCALYRE
jgi:hypothetical protein